LKTIERHRLARFNESVADISGIGTVRQIAGQVSLIDHPQRILSSAMERRRPSVRG
jgi:hypothetical protein